MPGLEMHRLHCGACMEDFETSAKLMEHIQICHYANYMLPLFYHLIGGNDRTGHPLSHFLVSVNKNINLIKRYAYSVSDDIGTLERSKLHVEMCEKLGINYNEFRPFESEEIKHWPNRDEAEEILLSAMSDYAKNKFIRKEV